MKLPEVRALRLSYPDLTPGSKRERLFKGPLRLRRPRTWCETLGHKTSSLFTRIVEEKVKKVYKLVDKTDSEEGRLEVSGN